MPEDLIHEIQRQLAAGQRVIVGIDGPCGSGKSTLATALQTRFACPVVHMDDFFLPAALRTPQRLAQPGGNIHYERFAQEVAAPLRAGRAAHYRLFRCATMDYAGEQTIAPTEPLVIVEGSYSLHPHWPQLHTIRVFLRCPPDMQRARILRRSGPGRLSLFEAQWMPMEQRYFDAFDIPARCHFLYNTGDPAAKGQTYERIHP